MPRSSGPAKREIDAAKTSPAEKTSRERKLHVLPVRSRSLAWWQFALIASLAFACYAQTLRYGFVYDDDLQIVRNPRIRGFTNLGAAFKESFWAFNAPRQFTNYYRPLQTVTYMIGYALGNLAPAPYHAINVALHVLASLAVCWVGWVIFQNAAVAFWAGLLFSVHPMHTESVAWIAGVTDLGCGLFFFISLGAYLRFRRRDERSWFWLLASLLTFFGALLFKEMALTLPLLIVLADLLCGTSAKDSSRPQLFKRYIPYVIVLLLYAVLRINALGFIAKTVNPFPVGPVDRILTIFLLLGRYLQKLALPVGQNAYYVFLPFSRLSAVDQVLPLCILVAFALLGWFFLRKEGKLLIPLAWMVITLIPVLSLGSVGLNVFAERYLYIPSLGICLLLAAVADRYSNESAKKAGHYLGITLIGILGFLTIHRNPVWSDNKTFYTSTLAVSPDATPLHQNLGILYYNEKNLAAARQEFQAVLDGEGREFGYSARDRYNGLLGLFTVCYAEGELDEAWRYADEARRLMPSLPDAYQKLGALMGRRGNYSEAETLIRRALEINPSHGAARMSMGDVHLMRGDLPAAEIEYRQAVFLDPTLSSARVNLGTVLLRLNRAQEALAVLKEALRLDPENAQARRLLHQIDSGIGPTR